MTRTLPSAEFLTIEFKSDHKCLSDISLIETIVCLANAEDGDLWLGAEDDGTPTGLHAEHRMLDGLPGLVAARTSPSVNVTVQALEVNGVSVARIAVPRAIRGHDFGRRLSATPDTATGRNACPCCPMSAKAAPVPWGWSMCPRWRWRAEAGRRARGSFSRMGPAVRTERDGRKMELA